MDRLSVLIAFIGLSAMALPADNKDFACTDQATAERYIHDLNIEVQSFGALELCRPVADTKKLFNDLRLIEEGRFQESAQNLFIQNFVNASGYYAWLVQQTQGIERGNGIPWATAFNSGGYFTLQDGWTKLSTLGRVGTLLHEARHTEGYSHTWCDHGPYREADVEGCDENVAQGGSHAVEMEYYARVHLQGTNFHPAYQSMARLMLLARSNFVFNENPAIAKEALLARTEDGLVKIDDNGLTRLSLPTGIPDAVSLKRTSLGATLLALPSGAWALDLVKPETGPALDDQYSYFKLLKMTPPAGLQDIEEFDFGLRRFLYAIDQAGRLFSYIFAEGAWSDGVPQGDVAALTTTDPSGRNGLFALFRDSTFCSVTPPSLTCDHRSLWPASTKKFVRFKNQTLRLNADGHIYDDQGAPWPELENETVLEMTVVPDYSVFD